MAEVEYSDRAVEWMDKADPPVREQILKRIDRAKDWPDHFLDPSTGSPYYKLRSGDYRCVIDWRKEEDLLFVRRIGHRRNIWDR